MKQPVTLDIKAITSIDGSLTPDEAEWKVSDLINEVERLLKDAGFEVEACEL